MKRMYWRPKRVSSTTLLLIASASFAGFVAVEKLPLSVQEPHYAEKLEAARIADEAFRVLKAERLKRRIPIDPQSDPAQSGMIGQPMTPITTNPGTLTAKQATANPNFAAVLVDYLKSVDVRRGDVVAVGYSGSFPSLNVAVLSAMEALDLRPVIVTSIGSSQWGANDPRFLWLDMEATLARRDISQHTSQAVSLGGIEDKALGMSKQGRRLLQRAIEKHQKELIDPVDFEDSIDQRMRLYASQAGTMPIRAYINVGGGTVSVGTSRGKKMYKSGLNRRLPPDAPDSVMTRFLSDGIPVIHLSGIRSIAEDYGFPYPALETPRPGEGRVFYKARYNRWLVAAVLFGILGALYLFVRSDLGFRITRSTTVSSASAPPEPMV